MDHSITIGSLIAVFGFVIVALSFYSKQKTATQQDTAKWNYIENTVTNANSDINNLKEDFKDFKHEMKEDLDKLDSQVISRIDSFDTKLDAIKNLLIEKLSQ